MIKRRMVRLSNETQEIVMFKRTIVSGLIATTVAAGSLVGTVQPSAAHGHHHRRELGIGNGRAEAGARLHRDARSQRDEFAHRFRRRGNTCLSVRPFLENGEPQRHLYEEINAITMAAMMATQIALHFTMVVKPA